MNAITRSLQGLGSLRVIVLALVGVALMGVFTFVAVNMNSKVLTPLYSGLTSEDSSRILTELGSIGVAYEVVDNGSKIMVDSTQVLNIRMTLAQKGMPAHGTIVGYEVFDKENALGTSDFVMNVNLMRALEGELSRTIGTLGSIKNARVHLVMPKREIFKKGKILPSASVVLTLSDRSEFPKNEVSAIKHLVASAVPGMKVDRVTIVDDTGRLLAKGLSGEEGDESNSNNAEEYKDNYEKKLKSTVTEMIEKLVGIGKVEIQVTADIVFDRITTSAEEFDPNGQVPRSVRTTDEKSSNKDQAGGEVSAANNIPAGEAQTSSGGVSGSDAQKLDEVTNFEISKKVTNKVSETGIIKRLSVAVLVDGRYDMVEKDGKTTENYSPRNDEELEQIKTLVKSAIGFDGTRGDVVEVINRQFARDLSQYLVAEGPFDWIKRDLDGIIKTCVVGIVSILAILLIVRPLVSRAFEISPLEAEDFLEAAAVAGGASEMVSVDKNADRVELDQIQTRMNEGPAKQVSDLVDNNPEESLAIIRAWMAQGKDKN
jgi:flagellar M-ring protein FliF